MDAEFWHERWARNEIGFHQSEINTHLQRFWRAKPGGTVFVPLCGKSRDMLWLLSKGHQVLGVEISAVAVEAFFKEHNLHPIQRRQGAFVRWEVEGLVILQGDFFALAPDDLAGVTAVYDRASLVALPEPMRADYARHLQLLLPQGVETLLVTLEYPQDEMSGPPFSVSAEEVRALYEKGYTLECIYVEDVLAENPRFRQRGISRMEEKVYILRPLQS